MRTSPPPRATGTAELYDSTTYFVIMRVFLAAINFVASIVSLEAFLAHLHRLCTPPAIRSQTIRKTIHIMLAGSALELVSCSVRAVHCAVGPPFSTTRLYFEAHILMFYVSVGIEHVTTLIAVLLFKRWGAFGSERHFLNRHLSSIIFLLAALLFSLNVALGIAQV